MIFKKIYTFLSATLLSLMILTPATALDDFDLAKYGPDDTIEIGRTSFIVKMVLYNFEEQINKEYEKITETDLPEGSGVRGFAIVSETADVCYIHIVTPKIWDDREAMAIFGHETYHCALAKHAKIIEERAAEAEQEEEESVTQSNSTKTTLTPEQQEIEDLYAEDRRLELENLEYTCKDKGFFTEFPAACGQLDLDGTWQDLINQELN